MNHDEATPRRQFLRTVAAGTCGLVGHGLMRDRPTAAAATSGKPILKNWIWRGNLRATSEDDLKRTLSDFRQAGIHGILLGGGYERVIPLAREAGIEVHAWTWALNNGAMQKKHPEWYTVNRNGVSVVEKPPYVGYYKWLCPTRPAVRRFLAERVDRLAATEGLAGVHLDYIRYCDVILPVALQPKYGLVQDREMPQFDYCYCSACRAAFKEKEGIDPLELPDPTASEAWRRFRWDSVTDVVNLLARVVHRRKLAITAAVFPTPALARKLVRQDWPRWNLNAVFPMIYHRFYNQPIEWIRTATREGTAALPKERPLYSGVYNLKPDELARAVGLASEGGAQGISVFGGFGARHQQALRATLDHLPAAGVR